MDEERQERIRYYSFAAFVGALLLLNVTGVWKTVFGIDTAAIITLLAGYKTFHNSISSLLEKRISADGIVDLGASSIDESSITGEPLPRDKQAGDEVFSGTLNGNGLLHIRVTRAGPETTLARVVALVQEAKQKPAPVERAADRYAKYFLPALLLAAALTFYFTGNWLRTVAVLIVACPCALILATPTAMVAAIGGL